MIWIVILCKGDLLGESKKSKVESFEILNAI